MLQRHLKGTCTEMTVLINQKGSCTESLSSATQPLWSPPVPSAHTQLRLSNKVPAASPELPHATRGISNPWNTILGGFQTWQLSGTLNLLYGEEEPYPKRKATILMKSHIRKDLCVPRYFYLAWMVLKRGWRWTVRQKMASYQSPL